MKVTVTSTGDVTFDTEDVAQAAAMIQALRNGKPKRRRRKPKPKPEWDTEVVETVELSPVLAETLEWVIANNDNGSLGISTAGVAAALGINEPAAGWRLGKLQRLGMIHRVSPGMWSPRYVVAASGEYSLAEAE